MADVIPVGRRIDWEGNVGVTGDIPTRTIIFSTLTSSATTTDINNAITACPSGQVVLLGPGTYTLSGSIQPKSGVTLRGAGMGTTILKGSSGFSGDGLISYNGITNFYLQDQTSFNLVSPLKGDTTITTSGSHGWSTGDYIQVDMLEDLTGDPVIQLEGSSGIEPSQSCRVGSTAVGCRPVGQTVKVTGTPSGTTATIDTPLYWTWNKTPQATKISSFNTGMGFEDFTLDNTLSQNAKILHFSGAFESWVLRVEMIYVVTYGLFVYGAYRSTVRSCKFHDGVAVTGGGYTVMLWNRVSGCLFEDNIIYNVGIMFLMDGSVTGNVFAYNFGTLPTYGNNFAGTEIGTHGAHPMMNLFEGNQFEGRFRFDYTWGTNSHNTLYRNRIVNDTNPSYDSARNLIDLWAYSRYTNILGNVLGTLGQETIYQETSGPINQSAKVVYAFGEISISADRGADSGVLSTVLRHGNWDSVNNAVRWEEDIVNSNHVLPVSLYRSVKPAWWGNSAWPPIGADLSPMTTDIPAKTRYAGGGQVRTLMGQIMT